MWWPFGLLLGATRFGLLSPVALTFIIDKTTNINIFFCQPQRMVLACASICTHIILTTLSLQHNRIFRNRHRVATCNTLHFFLQKY